MSVVILDVCPKCRVDVSRRFGLIKTPLITCRKCGYEMRVTAKAVSNNWQFNFAIVPMLIFWLVLAGIVLLNPDAATRFAAQSGKSKGTVSPWVLAALSLVPAFGMALPIAFVGRLLGFRVASRILSEMPGEPAVGEFSSSLFSSAPKLGRRELHSEQWMPASRSPSPRPKQDPPPSAVGIGRFFLRLVFGVLWAIVFIIVGSILISATAMALESGDQEARQKAIEAASRAGALPLFFGSILLVVILAKLGWLPGFRGRKAAAPAGDAALPRSKPSDSRVLAGG